MDAGSEEWNNSQGSMLSHWDNGHFEAKSYANAGRIYVQRK
jgi:hypothetical protein